MAKVLQSQLILSLVDRVTAPARGIQAQMDRMNAKIAATNEQANRVGGKLAVAAAQATGFALALAQPMKAAMSLEDKMADIAKVSDMSASQLKDFEGALRHMARSEIPIAVEQLAELAAAASASGIADDDLEAFTRQVAKSAVAWEVSGQYAGENLAKIKTALGMTIPETARYADAINFLSDATASNAPDLVEFARRVAADGKVAGFSNEQVLALGATMVSMGAEADVAATSLRNAQKALTRGSSATNRQAGAFMKLGLRAENVAKAMPTDAMGQFLEVLSRINALEQHERISTMSDLFGDEARALMPLLGELEKVREVTAAVGDETNYLGSVQKEFQQRAKTGRYALQKFNNQVRDIAISIGQSLLPAMKEILERLSPILLSVSQWTTRNGELVAKIIAVTGAIVGMRVALLALRYLGLTGKSGILSLIAFGMGTVGRAAAAMGAAAALAGRAGVAVLVASLVRARGAAIAFSIAASFGTGAALRMMAASVLSALNPLRLLRNSLGLVTAALRAIKVAVIGTGIGAILVGIALAGTWIYNNWNGLKEMFKAFGEAFLKAIDPIRPAINPVIDAIKSAFNWVGELTGTVDASATQWASWGTTVGTVVGEAVVSVANGVGKIVEHIGKAIAALKSLGEWAFTAPNTPATMPEGAGIVGRQAPIGQARAVGGYMQSRIPTLVGERGPEVIYPSRAGWVAHANQAKRLADLSRRARPSALPSRPAQSQGSRPVNVTFGNIVIQGGANASARDISREIGRTVQAELRGTFTDPY